MGNKRLSLLVQADHILDDLSAVSSAPAPEAAADTAHGGMSA